MKETKSVEWSYPTSPNADRFRFKDGCWTVQIIGKDDMPRTVAGFATRDEAIQNASKMPLPWNRLFLHYHPMPI